MIGPGKYDPVCTAAREVTHAEGLLLIVINGSQGSGFSAQFTNSALMATIPAALREMASAIEADLPKGAV